MIVQPNGKQRFVPLSEQWVNDNFEKSVIDLAISFGKEERRRKQRFFYLPPGDSKERGDNNKFLPDAPIVKYRQGEKNTCLTSSIASALVFLNEEAYGREMYIQGMDAIDHQSFVHPWETVRNLMFRWFPNWQPRRLRRGYDVIGDTSDSILRVIVLRAEDGSGGHAVAIPSPRNNNHEIQGDQMWIFDSTFEKALPLTQESLDRIMSPAKCVGIMMGYSFHIRQSEKRKRGKKRKR